MLGVFSTHIYVESLLKLENYKRSILLKHRRNEFIKKIREREKERKRESYQHKRVFRYRKNL